MTQFTDLGLSPKVLAAVIDAGYTTPTPIQAAAIPSALERKDVLGIAQTGTGKTAAFVLPMITLLEKGRARARMPRTLILEPTRELAAQVEENFVKYGKNHKLNVALLIGGVSFDEQERKLERGADVLIATPGRLLDHFERGKLMMNGVEILVIDEADRMLDMGFIPDIERIAKLTPMTRQTLFFSATMPPEITRLADQFLHAPVRVEVSKPAETAKTITQRLVACGSKDWEKRAKLRELIDGEAETLKNAIIFCNRKVDVADLLRSLQKHEYSVGALHGDMDQRSRMTTLDAFRNNRLTLLVASDVAARGLDIPDVSHVFNFDVPIHAEDYVHRIGRTGRAGRSGAAFMLVAKRDTKYLAAIEALTGDGMQWLDGDLSTVVESEGEERRGGRDGGRGKDGGRGGKGRERGGKGRDSGRESGRDRAPRAAPQAAAEAGAIVAAELTPMEATLPVAAEGTEIKRAPRRARQPGAAKDVAAPQPPRHMEKPQDRAVDRAAAEQPVVTAPVAPRHAETERPARRPAPQAEHNADQSNMGQRNTGQRNTGNDNDVGFGDETPAFMRNGLI